MDNFRTGLPVRSRRDRVLAPMVIAVALYITSENATRRTPGYDGAISFLSERSRNSDGGTAPGQCTPAQLSAVEAQLPPGDCLEHAREPWLQRCSTTYATRCPEPTWLERFYARSHGSAAAAPPFLGIFVGCNKGFDAVDAMRMGSGDPVFDRDVWRNAMTEDGTIKLGKDVCNQMTAPQFSLGDDAPGNTGSSFFQVHCIEPMPATHLALYKAAYETQYDKRGFLVKRAAMSRENGFALFSGRADKRGVENKGISNRCALAAAAAPAGRGPGCKNVTVYNLDTYLEKFVPENRAVNYLSIDVEGWDNEVLLGGARGALARVHYLEFEYNWVGPWVDQPLYRVIENLDEQFGFTCYWAGFNNTIWRITNCWLDHYDVHIWSNIACVNRNFDEVREVAEDMENLFLETMAKREDAVRDFEHRFQRNEGTNG